MCIALVLIIMSADFAQPQEIEDCSGAFSYERTSRVSMPESHHLFSELNFVQEKENGPWGYECNFLCMATTNCGGYYVDHTRGTCRLLPAVEPEQKRTFRQHRGTFFEKICIQGHSKCGKKWAFDRVIGMELAGHDDKVVTNITKSDCRRSCLNETQFTCRSIEYDFDDNICTLSRNDRRSRPTYFQPSQRNIDYLENQCITGPSKCTFERKNRTSTFFWMAYLKGSSVDQDTCEHQCLRSSSFTCRSYVIDHSHNACFLSSDDHNSLQISDYISTNSSDYYEKTSCIDVTMRCDSSTMTAVLTVETPFRGRIYSMLDPNRCVSEAADVSNEVTLTMPLDSPDCGTKSMGNGTFVNSIIVQHHPFILRSTDSRIDIACDYEEHKLQLRTGKEVTEDEVTNITSVVTGVAPTPDAKLSIVDANGEQVSGVELGTKLFLRVQLLDDRIFGIMGTELVARSGDGSESIVLINDRGCPSEKEIFSGLTRVGETKNLEGAFNAFRFTSDGVVHFQITVSFCLDQCKPVSCEDGDGGKIDSYGRRRRSSSRKGDIVSDVKMEGILHVRARLEMKEVLGNSMSLNYPQKTSSPNTCTSPAIYVSLSLALGTVQVAIICAFIVLTCSKRTRKVPSCICL